MKTLFRQIGIVGLTLTCLSYPAAAQGVLIGPNGVTIDDPRDNRGYDRRPDRGPDRGFDRRDDRRPDRGPDRRGVSEREAVQIARREGIREIDNVRGSRSTFRVDGINRRGRDMTVVIDRRSGEVLSVR